MGKISKVPQLPLSAGFFVALSFVRMIMMVVVMMVILNLMIELLLMIMMPFIVTIIEAAKSYATK